MSGHTPGPWAVLNVIDDECLLGFGIDNLGDAINRPAPWYTGWYRMNPADAQLIAAAPDMLQMLRYCHEWLQGNEPGRAAAIGECIAKAEGRA
jgi:hypothetical protein